MQPIPGLSRRATWAGDQPISRLMHQALAQPQLVSLAAGFVDPQTLPVDETRQACEAILSDPMLARAALQYGTTAGHPPLRARLLDDLLAADGRTAAEYRATVDQVVVTAGSNQLLHLLVDTLLDAGDVVLCTAPSYLVFLGAVQNVGARSVGVAMDQEGMIPEALEEQLLQFRRRGELHRVKAVYLVSYFDNPSSVTLSPARRPRIVELARRFSTPEHRIYVIEDAAYRALRYQGADIPSLRAFDSEGDTVILAQTFSKSFSPGIRVGYGVLPPPLVEPLLHQKGNIDFGSPNFAQYLIHQVLELGLYEPHVQRLCHEYRTKLQVMLAAADEWFRDMPGVQWTRPQGGLYVWLRLPEHVDTGPDGPLLDRAMQEGTLYVPGQYCYPHEGAAAARNMIRLSFGVQSPEGIRRGMQLLARAAKRVLEET